VSSHPQITRFLEALDQTQYLPPDRMVSYQRRLLERLLRHAREQTDFYPDRIAPVFSRDGRIDWERWREIPILTRAEAQEQLAAMTARSLPPAAGHRSEDSSSGSTGRPLRHYTTAIQNLASACSSERFFRWHGLDPALLTARIRASANPESAYPHGRPATGWRAGHDDSRVIDLGIAARTEDQIEWLRRVRPAYLASYPSNLREIGRRLHDSGEQLHFDAIMTFGEMVTDDAAVSIRDCFGKEPLDRYGSSEVGHIAATCPQSLKLHIAADLVLVELLDPDGRPAEAGAEGRVVVTPFYNFAMPMIRYALGDFAIQSAEPCPCGRTLPLFERVLGRTRNVFRFIDGSSTWPVLLSKDVQSYVPYRQAQFVQTSRTEIEFRYVPAAAGQMNDLAGLTDYMRRRLHPSVQAIAVPVEEIKRSPGGKFEDYVSLVC
jgi:phenylacetate-CoA ligase